MLETLKNLGKALLFPLTLTSFVCLGITRGMFEVAKFSSEFVAKRVLGITKKNGYKSDYEAKILGSAIDRVNSFSSWFYGKSVKMPFSFFAQSATEGSGKVKTEKVFKEPKPTKEELLEEGNSTWTPETNQITTNTNPKIDDSTPNNTTEPSPTISANYWSALGDQNQNEIGV